MYLARLEVDEFADAGFGADDTLQLESTKAIIVDRFAPYVRKLELWNIWPGESEAASEVLTARVMGVPSLASTHQGLA